MAGPGPFPDSVTSVVIESCFRMQLHSYLSARTVAAFKSHLFG